MITYDELAAGLEDAWLMAGLHDHLLAESVLPDSLERAYRAELFWAQAFSDARLNWTPAHQLRSEGRELSPGPLELAWTYTIDVREQADRGDIDLTRAFNAAVRTALRRAAPDIPAPAEYVAVEVRRGYRSSSDKPVLAYVQLVGTNVTDLSDLWDDRNPNALREALRDELIIVAALLHALGETFEPSGLGGYRPVDTA